MGDTEGRRWSCERESRRAIAIIGGIETLDRDFAVEYTLTAHTFSVHVAVKMASRVGSALIVALDMFVSFMVAASSAARGVRRTNTKH